jgi:hypothetical protein
MRISSKKILRVILDSLGLPASLRHFLAESQDLKFSSEVRSRTIDVTDVATWHEWGKGNHAIGSWRAAGELLGWRSEGSEFCSYRQTIEALARLGFTEIVKDWECEIQDVEGIAASKADLAAFSTLDEMAVQCAGYLAGEVSNQNLAASLGWPGGAILHINQTEDYLAYHQWDRRVFLMNSDGSHHFVAGRYLAARLGVTVPLTANLHIHRISSQAVAALVADFEIFALSDDPSAFGQFHDAMRSYRAGYLWIDLPRTYTGGRAVFLPRTDHRSMKVASLLRDEGHSDLGAHLMSLARIEVPFQDVQRSVSVGVEAASAGPAA